jgi:hypothetical protein
MIAKDSLKVNPFVLVKHGHDRLRMGYTSVCPYWYAPLEQKK